MCMTVSWWWCEPTHIKCTISSLFVTSIIKSSNTTILWPCIAPHYVRVSILGRPWWNSISGISFYITKLISKGKIHENCFSQLSLFHFNGEQTWHLANQHFRQTDHSMISMIAWSWSLKNVQIVVWVHPLKTKSDGVSRLVSFYGMIYNCRLSRKNVDA
jgi:hypothetical protein